MQFLITNLVSHRDFAQDLNQLTSVVYQLEIVKFSPITLTSGMQLEVNYPIGGNLRFSGGNETRQE